MSTASEQPTDTTADPFDPANLRLTGEYSQAVAVKKLLLTVPVKKPERSWFVRTHPDDAFWLQTAVIEQKEDRAGEYYLVSPTLWPDLATETMLKPVTLALAINKQNVPFIWPLKMPGADGRQDAWGRSGLEAAACCRTAWCRVCSNMSLSAYEVSMASGDLGSPQWPAVGFKELLRVAFRDRLIESLDHPVLRQLRGDV